MHNASIQADTHFRSIQNIDVPWTFAYQYIFYEEKFWQVYIVFCMILYILNVSSASMFMQLECLLPITCSFLFLCSYYRIFHSVTCW